MSKFRDMNQTSKILYLRTWVVQCGEGIVLLAVTSAKVSRESTPSTSVSHGDAVGYIVEWCLLRSTSMHSP